MTANQVAYQNYKENMRSNIAKERETKRSNLAKEAETNRTNLANESIKARTNDINAANMRINRHSAIANTFGQLLDAFTLTPQSQGNFFRNIGQGFGSSAQGVSSLMSAFGG